MLVHSAQAALHCQAQGPSCWQTGVNAIDARFFRPAVAAASKQLRPRLWQTFRSQSHRSARTSPALPNGTDFQVQSPDVLQYSGAPPDIFQSALTALDLVSPTESYDPDYNEQHEDISLEQGQAAAQVGKAVYEVKSRESCKRVLVVHRSLKSSPLHTGPQVVKYWQDTKDICKKKGRAEGKPPAAEGPAAH